MGDCLSCKVSKTVEDNVGMVLTFSDRPNVSDCEIVSPYLENSSPMIIQSSSPLLEESSESPSIKWNYGKSSSSLKQILFETMRRDISALKWAGNPSGINRGINHPKESDYSCDLLPIDEIISPNIDLLLHRAALNKEINDSRPSLSMSSRYTGTLKSSLVCKEGFTLQILEDLLDSNEGSRSYVTRQLVDNVFDPLTKDARCSLLSKLKSKTDSNGNPAVNRLEYFVSYSWYYKIGDIVLALREFENSLRRKPDKPVYFFLDCVCVNQYQPMRDLEGLDMIILGNKGLVTVIIDWKDPVPFRRA